LLHCHLHAGQALTLVAQCLLQQHSTYVRRGTRYLPVLVTVYFVVLQCIGDLSSLVLKLSLIFLQLKVDKLKLIDLCGTSSTEFTTVQFIHILFVCLRLAAMCTCAVCSLELFTVHMLFSYFPVLITGFNINDRPLL